MIKKDFKKRKIPFLLLISFFCTVLSLSCEEANPLDDISTDWTVRGTAEFKGTPVSNVKLAAFFVENLEQFDSSAIFASNVVDLSVNLTFLLNINANELPANTGDTIDLIMWEDDNNDNIYDTGENYQYTEPQASCPVFDDAVKNCFFYSKTEDIELGVDVGWNIDLGNLISYSVEEINMNDALITNWYTW